MEKETKFYLSKDKTGLPFHIVKDTHFHNYSAKHENGMLEKLTLSDIINIHLLVEIKKINNGKQR